MKKPGRKSAAELSVRPVIQVVPREPAPDDLTDAEAKIWEEAVSTMAAGFFTAADRTQLAAYCRHAASSKAISGWIEKALANPETELGELDKLHAMRDRETRTALACSRSLRLTQLARHDAKTAANRVASEPEYKPWEFE